MRSLIAVLVIILLLPVLLVLGLNTSPGFRAIEAGAATAGVRIQGLGGRFPDRLHADSVVVADAQGPWLTVDNLALDWSPTALVRQLVKADSITASSLTITRYPTGNATASAAPSTGGGFSLPDIAIGHLKIDQINLPEAKLSADAALRLTGDTVDARVDVATPDAQGHGPAHLVASLAGPRDKAALQANLEAAGSKVAAVGTLDLAALTGDVTLTTADIAAGGVSAGQVSLHLDGGSKSARVHAELGSVRLPDAPADARPVHLILDGTVDPTALTGDLTLTSDAIAVAGAGAQAVTVHLTGGAAHAQAHGVITGLRIPGSRPELLGPQPITLDATYGPDLALDLQTGIGRLSVRGPVPGATIAADWRLELEDLTQLAPTVPGSAILAGQISGPLDNITATTSLDAKLASGPVAGTITLHGLPASPVAAAKLTGSWNGMAASLDADASRDPAGVFHATLNPSAFDSLQALGSLVFDPALGWPTGKLTLNADRLPQPVTGGGRAHATIDFTRPNDTPTATIAADINGLAMAGVSLARGVLAATVTNPLGEPAIRGDFTATNLTVSGRNWSGRLDAQGTQAALALRLAATGTAALNAAGTLDAHAMRLSLASLQVAAEGQTLRLTAPVRVDFANGVTVDRLRLSLGAASLEVAGRLSPALDATAAVRALPLSLAKLFAPTLDIEGSLSADATLRGAPASPSGTVRVSGTGIRVRSAAFVPPTTLTATATLNGTNANVDAQLAAGPTRLSVTGTAPMAATGAFDLRATGSASLALLDAFLAGSGRQARGTVSLDARYVGNPAVPSGTLTLRGGSFTDIGQGVRLSDIAASVRADGQRVVLESLTARSGGAISAQGSLDLAGDQAVIGSLTARDISPLTSDALTARMSADLTAGGSLVNGISVGGTIRLARADINIPQTLPSSLPTLVFRKAGPPPPPPAPPLAIALDITLTAPGQIFVRGRGIDAELAGQLHIGGTAAAPRPDGGFTLRRGTLSIAGQSLDFTTGQVSFDGHVPIDPTLNFVARSVGSSVTATLTVSGTASHPRIALSSQPELPQDEVLAQLLFHRSAASLTPFQIAQIATGLAQLADVGGSGGFDPLDRLRKGLGLDVLSVGGGQGTASPSVQAGRNIARGVYLGAKQSTGGTGTQATVRLDLARGLRLEADLGQAPPAPTTSTPGAPPTGNQVGITYEFEY